MAVVSRAGGGKATAHDIEKGQRVPTVGTVARLASGLGLRAGWLAYGLGEPPGQGSPSHCERMGTRLQSVRVARGLTKTALGRLAELTAPSITQIEAGGQSGIDVVEALARALGISPAWLAFNEGPQLLPSRRRGRLPAQSSAPVS
jgi:transcriptional regulator with XRE-family HTH domain